MSFQIPSTVRTVTDVTASRAIDGTVYTNNTGNTLFVNVYFTSFVGAVNPATAQVTSTVDITFMDGIGFKNSAALTVMEGGFHIGVIVPPGSTYSMSKVLVGAGSTVNLKKWIESY